MKMQLATVQKRLCGGASRTVMAMILLAAAAGSANAAVNQSNVPSTLSKDVIDLVNKAQQAMKSGHPEIAVIYLKNAEATAGDSAQIHLDLGQALLAVGNASAAEQELNTARQKGVPADKVLPLLYEAMLAQREGQLLLNRYPAPAPADRSNLAVETLRARAVASLQTGKLPDAVAALDRALAINRTAPNLATRAQLALAMGDSNMAGSLVDEALKKAPTNVAALGMKIGFLQKANQLDQALNYANMLVKGTNDSPQGLVARAGVYLQLKQDAKAQADLDAALAKAPNLPQAIFFKAVTLARAHDAKAAWALAQTLPRNYSYTRADVGTAVGQMAIDAGQRETGTDMLHSVVQAFPTDPEARVRLAASYLALGESSQAIDTLTAVQNSTDPRVSALLAQAYAVQKDYTQSFKYVQKASAGGYGGDALKLQLATVDLQSGDLDGALRILEQLNANQGNRPEVVGPLIDVLLKKGNMGAAVKVADAFSKAAPENPFGPLYQGGLLAQKGDIDGAIADYTAALKRNPKFVPALINRGDLLATRGDGPAAIADLQAAVSADPKNTAAVIALVQALNQSGQDDKAALTLKKAAQINPKNFMISTTLAQYLAARKRYDEAIDVANTFLRTVPGDANALALLGNLQLVKGDTDQAIATFTQLQKTAPKEPGPKVMLARAVAKKGNAAAARTMLNQVIAASPKARQTYLVLIEMDVAAKRPADALADANRFVTNSPGPDSSLALAEVQVQQNKLAEAQQTLQKSLTDHPDPRTLFQLSSVLRQLGREKAANDVLASWLAKYPDDLNTRLSYGTAQMTLDKADAEKQFRMVVAKQPYNLTALNNLAWLLREKNPKEGLIYAARAQKLAPNLASVIDTVGWIRWQLNDRGQVVDLLTKAHAAMPADPEIGYHLAAVLNGSGRSADAKKIVTGILADGKPFEDREKAKALAAQIH